MYRHRGQLRTAAARSGKAKPPLHVQTAKLVQLVDGGQGRARYSGECPSKPRIASGRWPRRGSKGSILLNLLIWLAPGGEASPASRRWMATAKVSVQRRGGASFESPRVPGTSGDFRRAATLFVFGASFLELRGDREIAAQEGACLFIPIRVVDASTAVIHTRRKILRVAATLE